MIPAALVEFSYTMTFVWLMHIPLMCVYYLLAIFCSEYSIKNHFRGFTVRSIFQINSEQLSKSRNIKHSVVLFYQSWSCLLTNNHMMTSSPLLRLRHYARRQYICFEATFAINAFEPWEKALFCAHRAPLFSSDTFLTSIFNWQSQSSL